MCNNVYEWRISVQNKLDSLLFHKANIVRFTICAEASQIVCEPQVRYALEQKQLRCFLLVLPSLTLRNGGLL